jgi:uncharacterized protein
MTFSTTQSGQVIDLLNPNSKLISLADLALGLSRINRFNGQTRLGPLSVAQHSVTVVKIIQQGPNTPLLSLQALLHDGHEYLLGDISSPAEAAIAPEIINRRKRDLDLSIYRALQVPYPDAASATLINRADRVALATEWRDLMPTQVPAHWPQPANFSVKPLSHWTKAHDLFVALFTKLFTAAKLTPHP